MDTSEGPYPRHFLFFVPLLLVVAFAATSFLGFDIYLKRDLVIVAALALITTWLFRKNLVVLRWKKGFSISLLLLVLAFGLYGGFMFLAFENGLLVVSYANAGHDPSFRQALPKNALLVFALVVLGIEAFFRAFALRALLSRIEHAFAPILIQCFAFVFWFWIVARESLQTGGAQLIFLELLGVVLLSALSAIFYLRSNNILVSGVWTAIHLFVGTVAISDVEFGFNTAAYLVTSSNSFYFWRSGVLLLLLIVFYLLCRDNLRIEGDK